jgi:hypothetical protein
MPAGTVTQACWPAPGVSGAVHHDATAAPFHLGRWRERHRQPWPVGAPVYFETFDTPNGPVARFLRDSP